MASVVAGGQDAAQASRLADPVLTSLPSQMENSMWSEPRCGADGPALSEWAPGSWAPGTSQRAGGGWGGQGSLGSLIPETAFGNWGKGHAWHLAPGTGGHVCWRMCWARTRVRSCSPLGLWIQGPACLPGCPGHTSTHRSCFKAPEGSCWSVEAWGGGVWRPRVSEHPLCARLWATGHQPC